MKRTEDEIFSLLGRACAMIWDGDWYRITGHNEDEIYCEDDTGDEVYLQISDLAEQEVDFYEEVLITDRGDANVK